ncbi:elongation factor Ts [Thermobispora bispora]|jgi:elongation factor Ts|uniref:Elongation factor Ts n=1 Tax=Thermobispora bispora (strain ATCC 19993 / DSM 43833 / CBS 139.67 / JCM 10125 / KCTC 9307 / NBRC 14880 / R51) TaxID=469371 RepID=D6Y7C3_THEBD|nr:translation elongation factor Ts [Thermobispora bispora]ADG87718.1 translation elongation factor Ts [Thermobispora bispora DSM 43833]MBO2473056.1 elongation factor Ts [Actinomycetales bacterium]MBX6167420.1 elongation factor Ts [Thermobispora bispora]QSI47625.1 elongation factor Ts [Thermobispora bispora]
MASVSMADVKRLRELTAAGMMDCKKALEEAGGDFDKAIELLRLKGAKDVGKREARTASNGLIAVEHVGDSLAALLELNCETDFVAKNERFQALARDIVKHIAATKPADVPTLLESQIDGKTVKERLDETNAALGEKIEIRRFTLLEGGYITSYLHKTDPQLPPAIGVLVQLDKPNAEVAKDIAQHTAAMAPKYLSPDTVPAEVVQKERELYERMTREEGKPEAAIPKIVEGRLNAWYKDFTLLEQAFVKDNKKTIRQVAEEAGVKVLSFTRYKVGQA